MDFGKAPLVIPNTLSGSYALLPPAPHAYLVENCCFTYSPLRISSMVPLSISYTLITPVFLSPD